MFDQENSLFDKYIVKIQRRYRSQIEKYIIYYKERWGVTALLFLTYLIRVGSIGGYYVVSYIFGLYLMHLGVQFLTPQGLPSIDEDEDDDMVGSLPLHTTNSSAAAGGIEPDSDWNEKGTLLRSMSEFKVWHKITIATLMSLFCTTSRVFDLPVFYPFLLAYFIMLAIFTAKRQMRHMQKYNYSIFDFFKKGHK